MPSSAGSRCSRRVTSPRTNSALGCSHAGACPDSWTGRSRLSRTRTAQPCSTSRSTVCEPMKPAPPVTSTRIGGIVSRRCWLAPLRRRPGRTALSFMRPMSARRFVVLDRDGTLIVEKHYLSDPDAVELIQGAGVALRRLRDLGLGLVVVTNQSGVARGLFSRERLAEIHSRLEVLLAAEGVRLQGIYFCPHHPDVGCGCRKPRTALLERAARELHFEPRRAFVVGDLASDVELGRAVGATTVLVRTGHGAREALAGGSRPNHVAGDLVEAAALIERLLDVGQPG